MAEDLRRTMAKAKLKRQKAPRGKWAPGYWAAAAAYNATKPEVRCPVIIGGNSMFQTPEDLRDILQLPSAPPLTQTTETTLSRYPDEKGQGQDKETLDIADVSLGQYLGLRNLTEGDKVVVWFRGERRFAWLPSSRKTKGSVTVRSKAKPTMSVVTKKGLRYGYSFTEG